MEILGSIREGQKRGLLTSKWPSAELVETHFAPLASGHQTNCSSFTSAVLLGAAVKAVEEGGTRWEFLPEWQMWANSNWGRWKDQPKPWAGTENLPRVYQERPEIGAWLCAGFATEVSSREAAPDPGAWYICSNGSHSYFIVDYVSDSTGSAGLGKCLTLESSTFGVVSGRFKIGFVGHNGYWDGNEGRGLPIGDGPPADWAKRVQSSRITWGELSGHENFICARINMKSAAPKFVCPLDSKDASPNLWKHYANNEMSTRGVGGYYAVGLQRTFHGGIHLFPEKGTSDTPIRVLAPGHVVAARLPPVETLDKERIKNLGNWPGFVLVRHELIELDSTNAGKGPPAPFYSLSMHVRSPRYVQQGGGQRADGPRGQGQQGQGQGQGQANQSGEVGASAQSGQSGRPAALPQDERYFTEVKWFRSLVERRFGAFVRVMDDPLAGLVSRGGAAPEVKVGEVVWAATKVEVDGQGVPKGDRFAVSHPDIAEITLKVGDTVAWLYKPPPAKLLEAVEALAAGKVVTFTDRFFPVAAGETVGLLAPLPVSLQSPTTIGRRPFESGFLHWQVFAPVGGPGESGIALLERLAGKVSLSAERAKAEGLEKADGLTLREVVDEGDNAFIDTDDLKSSLGEALPEADRQRFREAFPDLPPEVALGQYASRVIEFLDGATSFAPKPAQAAVWEAGCAPSYPMVLQLDAQHLMSPEKNAEALVAPPEGVDPPPQGKYYLLTFEFLSRAGGALQPMRPQRGCAGSKCCLDTSYGACKPRPLAIDEGAFRAARQQRDRSLLVFPLVVPAEADVMRVTLRGGLVAEGGAAVQGSEVLLLRDAAKERWRGSRLRHLIEWSPEYFKKVSEALAKLSVEVDLTAEVQELAWCDPEKEVPIGRVTYDGAAGGFVPGSSTEAPKLFGPKGLVRGGKVDNLHPVTATWLLNAVERLQLARLNEGGQAPSFGQADGQPLCAGWVVKGPGSPRLGDVVRAVVVDDDYDADEAARVRLIAKQGDTTLHLAEDKPDPNGVLVRDVTVSFWGDWALETGPKAAKKSGLFGPQRLSIPAPESAAFSDEELALGLDELRKLPDGTLQLAVKVKEPVAKLEGFLRFEVSAEDAPGPLSPGSHGLSVTAEALVATPRSPPTQSASPSGSALAGAGPAPSIPLERDKLAFSPDGRLIVGLATGATGDAKLAEGLKLGEFASVSTQVRLACVLLDALVAGAKAGALVVDRIAPEGLEVRVRAATKKDATKVLGALQGASELVAVVPEGDAAGHLTLKAAEATLLARERCERLTPHEALLDCDARHRYVLDLKRPIGCITPAMLRTAFYAGRPMRLALSVVLLRALAQLRGAIKHVTPIFLGVDGYTCRIQEAGEPVLKAARATGCFLVAEPWPAGGTLLAVCPDPERTLVARFHPSAVLRSLAESLRLGPGEPMRYRVRLVIPNGLHYLRSRGEALPRITEPDDPAPLTAVQGVTASADFDKLLARAAGKLEMPPSGERVARLIALSAPALSWVTEGGKPVVRVVTRLLGPVDAWAGFKLRVSADMGRGAAVLKGYDAVKAESLKERGLLSLSIPVTSSLTGALTVKVEALPPPWSADAPPAVERSEDYTPRWVDDALVVSRDPETKRVELRCGTSGVARAKRAGGLGRLAVDRALIPEFQLTIERVGPSVTPVAGKPPKLPTQRLQVPTQHGFGCVDEQGVFLAYLDERELEPGASYRFELKLREQYQGREKGLLPARHGVYPAVGAVPGASS